MDGFEVRMYFIEMIRKMNASQQSIQKVVSFAAKHFPSCGEDIWDCIVEHTENGSSIPESMSSTFSTRFAKHL